MSVSVQVIAYPGELYETVCVANLKPVDVNETICLAVQGPFLALAALSRHDRLHPISRQPAADKSQGAGRGRCSDYAGTQCLHGLA